MAYTYATYIVPKTTRYNLVVVILQKNYGTPYVHARLDDVSASAESMCQKTYSQNNEMTEPLRRGETT